MLAVERGKILAIKFGREFNFWKNFNSSATRLPKNTRYCSHDSFIQHPWYYFTTRRFFNQTGNGLGDFYFMLTGDSFHFII